MDEKVIFLQKALKKQMFDNVIDKYEEGNYTYYKCIDGSVIGIKTELLVKEE
jgi:hypothetical protein